MLNFHELEAKYGCSMAYQCLVEIEKAANIPSWKMTELAPEILLANAIQTQDAMRVANVLGTETVAA